MLATTLLVGQVLVERYTRTVAVALLFIVGGGLFFAVLAAIFLWIGAELPPEQAS